MTTLRSLPSIDRLLLSPATQPLLQHYPRERVVEALRQAVAQMREALKDGAAAPGEPEKIAADLLARSVKPRLVGVINATGVVLHTNLGRAPLSALALERIREVAGYSNLELDLSTGERGSRYSHVQRLLQERTGAPAALVVNNCAAAMLLIVDELAKGREVVVSRGELVEIGGGFRVPDVLTRGGARLVEVGTTNRTYVRDYEAALTENTGMLLSTHTSNFRVTGFVESPRPEDLVALGRERGIPVVLDLGSGLLEPIGNAPEPTVPEMVRAGFDLVAFSGDKLLGGPQAGIIVGQESLVRRLGKNPLMRALRPDKLAIAALEGTLLDDAVPVLQMLSEPLEKVRARAQKLARRLRGLQARVVESSASVGGGSMPERPIPSFAVEIRGVDEEEWAARLRSGEPPLLVRRQKGALLLDARTLKDEQLPLVARALAP